MLKGSRKGWEDNTSDLVLREEYKILGSEISARIALKPSEALKRETEDVVIKKIIDGKMYDTSRAKKICTIYVSREAIPEELQPAEIRLFVDAISVCLYQGNSTCFCTFSGEVFAVSEEWVKKWLGRCDADKYIELFGEPELA